MLSISKLFESDDHGEVSKLISLVPKMSPPSPNTRKYHDDIEAVKFYIRNSSLDDRFLSVSHDSVDKTFKMFCNEYDLNFNFKEIKSNLQQIKKVSRHLKNKYRRPRPRNELIDMSSFYEDVEVMKSYSFPSGHTCRAYFVAGILSDKFPDKQADFEMIAQLIGQSRIENGVHYPSDVVYGRLLGEFLADHCLNNEEKTVNIKRGKEENKAFAVFLRGLSSNPRKTAIDIGDFLYKTLQIEQMGNMFKYSECFDAGKNLLTSMSDDNISSNPYVRSQCKALRESFCNKKQKDLSRKIHMQFSNNDLDSGAPGEFRSYSHKSPTGVEYCDPENFNIALKNINSFSDPFVRHALFEWIHPFCDGNGRSGRILLCAECNYDFQLVNNFINKDYFKTLDLFYCNNDVSKLLLGEED